MQGDADCIILLKRLCAETVIKLNGICTTGGAERQYEKRSRRSEIIIL